MHAVSGLLDRRVLIQSFCEADEVYGGGRFCRWGILLDTARIPHDSSNAITCTHQPLGSFIGFRHDVAYRDVKMPVCYFSSSNQTSHSVVQDSVSYI